jgi:hypothetical protein
MLTASSTSLSLGKTIAPQLPKDLKGLQDKVGVMLCPANDVSGAPTLRLVWLDPIDTIGKAHCGPDVRKRVLDIAASLFKPAQGAPAYRRDESKVYSLEDFSTSRGRAESGGLQIPERAVSNGRTSVLIPSPKDATNIGVGAEYKITTVGGIRSVSDVTVYFYRIDPQKDFSIGGPGRRALLIQAAQKIKQSGLALDEIQIPSEDVHPSFR